MATDLRARAPAPAVQPVGGTTQAVARMVGRRASRSAALWGLIFGIYVVSSISGYASTYPTLADREGITRSFGSNVGVAALIGPARALETVAGFIAWRGSILCLVGAVWAVLAATRLLRGEEEAGRAELLLAGQTTRRGAALQSLAGLAMGWLTLTAITVVLTIAGGGTVKPALPVGASLYFTLAATAPAAMFLAVGALTSQLARSRRRAASIGGAVVGVSYLIRMVADSGSGLAWLRWASPLGWYEELRPFTGSHPLAFIPVVAFTVVVAAVSARLAAGRDLGDSTLPEADTARPRTALLNGPGGLSVRLMRPMALIWAAAIALLTFVMGLVAKGAAPAITGSPSAERFLERLGGNTNGELTYMGVGFLVAATLMGLVASAHNVANREEEATGRLDNLLVRPLSRRSWLTTRLATEAGILVVIGLVTGVTAWVGGDTQHSGMGLGTLIEASLNTVPSGLFILGVGAAVHGAAPRWVAPVTYGLVAWAFQASFLAEAVKLNHWILDTSFLYHMRLAPAFSPNWGSDAGLVGVGLAGAVLGAALLRRRDLAGE
jgi:ABC-2 type transport system permease protein